MKKYQNKIISIPNLYRDLMVHFGSKETLRKVLCKYVDEETAANAVDAIGLSDKGCIVINQQKGVFFVWMPRKPQSAEDFGFLVHELLHAVSETMRMIGVDFSEDSEEVYALHCRLAYTPDNGAVRYHDFFLSCSTIVVAGCFFAQSFVTYLLLFKNYELFCLIAEQAIKRAITATIADVIAVPSFTP